MENACSKPITAHSELLTDDHIPHGYKEGKKIRENAYGIRRKGRSMEHTISTHNSANQYYFKIIHDMIRLRGTGLFKDRQAKY